MKSITALSTLATALLVLAHTPAHAAEGDPEFVVDLTNTPPYTVASECGQPLGVVVPDPLYPSYTYAQEQQGDTVLVTATVNPEDAVAVLLTIDGTREGARTAVAWPLDVTPVPCPVEEEEAPVEEAETPAAAPAAPAAAPQAPAAPVAPAAAPVAPQAPAPAVEQQVKVMPVGGADTGVPTRP